MSGRPVLLVGAGGHAQACIDVIECHGHFTITGLTGLTSEVGQRLLGYPVLGDDSHLPALLESCSVALVTVGQIKTAELRVRLFDLLSQFGAQLPVIISPRAYVSPHATLGAGTIVMHGAVVNAGAVVGRNCIINSQALVEHGTWIDDHCHVATGAALNSGVRVGARTFLGSHSTVRQGTQIGEGCVIGMGQQVLRDCDPGSHLPAKSPPASTKPGHA